jgi:ceramide glucosyltransferase
MTTILFFVWAAGMAVAIWAARIAQIFASKNPRRAQQSLAAVCPPVAVILPIKGVDEDTPGNVEALLAQDYPNYRLIFAIESEDDPVAPLLERLARDHEPGKIEVVVAGISQDRGQKVHNQLAGVDRTTEKDEILAFMDADAKPAANWVHSLVTPLTYGTHIGAATGYRFYIPSTGHKANGVVSAINSCVAALFGPYRRTFAWGGSMAVRRPDFFNYKLHEAWQHALSDDYVLSHCVRDIGKANIHFVPQCLVASDANFTWKSLFEFAVRQYRITRICAPLVWLAATSGAMLYLFALIYPIVMAVYSLGHPEQVWWHFVLMFAFMYLASLIRGVYLMVGGKRLLPSHAAAINGMWLWYTLAFPAVHALNLLTLLAAAMGNRIVWRGVAYTMVNRTKTIVHRTAAKKPAVVQQAELVTSGK